jgi:hypothetical protein
MADESKSKPTACEDGGDEIKVFSIPAQKTSTVELSVRVCRTASWLYADVDGATIVDQEIDEGEIHVALGALAPGSHYLIWGLLNTNDEWQARCEVKVDGVVRFRHRKTNTSDAPLPKWMVALVVA